MRKTYLYIFFCCKYKQLPLNVQGEIPISARESPKSLLDVEEIVTEGELEYAGDQREEIRGTRRSEGQVIDLFP